MADNTTLNAGTGGDIIATDDIGGVKYQRVKATWGSDGTATDVDATNPLPTSLNASIFRFSTNNSSSAELASNATFTGTIETALDQPSISLLMTSDQPITLTIYQYIDASGVYAVPPIVYYVPANQGLSASFALNGNYVKVTAKNTGTATTTTFELNTAYGNLPASDGSGRLPVSKADCIQLLNTTITTTGPGTSIDTVGYGAIVVQLSGTWQGFGIFEASNDGTVWDSILTFSRDNLSLIDLVTSGGLYTIRPSGRYIRFNVTQLTGNIAINAQGRSAEGIAASDLLSLAMDRNNNTPLHVQLDDVALSRLPPTNLVKLFEFPISTAAIPATTTIWSADVSAFRSLVIHAGAGWNLEQSINGTDWTFASAQSSTGSVMTQGLALTATNQYYCTVGAPFMRLRGASGSSSQRTVVYGSYTAIVPAAGSVQVFSGAASQLQSTVNLSQIGSNTIGVLTQVTGAASTASLAVAASGPSNSSTEVTSAARTATGNSGSIGEIYGGAISAVIAVTAAGGTTPTLDIALQESYDGGTTWQDVYHCERLTGNGTLVVPPIQVYGRRRWAWTITGTTPTFTFPISVSRGGFGFNPFNRQFFDRTAALINGSATGRGVSFQMLGCKIITATLTCGAVTTGATYKLQGSNDNGANWFDLTTTAVTAVASSTVVITNDTNKTARHVALNCVSTGTGQTGTVVSIVGTS